MLSLLSDASAGRPLVCLIDDVQWLDRVSAQVLGLVARRLLAESILLLFGTRAPRPELAGLPGLDVAGLADPDAHRLLSRATHARLDTRIRDRIVAESQGNPLALLELPRGLTATQLAGGLGLLDADMRPGRIEQGFRNRIRDLPAPARLVLLIAAAEPIGDPDLVRRAAERLGVPLSAALADGTDGLLTVGERATFRHPLVRSAVYRAADPRDRQAVHLALAEVTDADDAPDTRAWHHASAAAGPDEAVAAELERSAGRAQVRGGMAAAAAFLQRAVAMTADPGRRIDRILAAAEASLAAGELEDVGRLLGTAEARPLDPLQRGRAGVLRGQIAFASGEAAGAVARMIEAAAALKPVDRARAGEAYVTAWGMAVIVARPDAVRPVARAIRDLPAPADPGLLDLLLEGFAAVVTDGWAAAAASLQQAVRLLRDAPAADVVRWGWIAGAATMLIWDDEAMWTILQRQARLVREAGALREVPYHLTAVAMVRAWSGDFAGAAAAAAEAGTVAAATGNLIPPYGRLRLASLRGREAETETLIDAVVREAAVTGFGLGLGVAHWAGTVLYNGLARYPEAMRAARAHSDGPDPGLSTWILPELVEAASRAGEPDVARDALTRFLTATQPFTTDFAAGWGARSRALMSQGPAADALYREAIERFGRTRLRPELARAHLLYGEWLRRERRRIDARHQLRTAVDLFDTIGMAAFADRTRRELQATGETVRRAAIEPGAGVELSPQERQIAQLVRDGFSNPEVGARLFLSPRTVEWHLRKVFTKLNITSRRQLRDVLT